MLNILLVDDDEEFTIDSSRGKSLLWVAVHELGHSIGLEHSNVREAVMFPWYRDTGGKDFNLNTDDKRITLAPILNDLNTPILPERHIQYDKLVIAIGSVSNDFNTLGVKEHCYFLDSHHQADRFHHALLELYRSDDQPIIHHRFSRFPLEPTC